jgi:hypothetical protein
VGHVTGAQNFQRATHGGNLNLVQCVGLGLGWEKRELKKVRVGVAGSLVTSRVKALWGRAVSGGLSGIVRRGWIGCLLLRDAPGLSASRGLRGGGGVRAVGDWGSEVSVADSVVGGGTRW